MMKFVKSQIHEQRAVVRLIAAIWLMLMFQGCAEVPITQRKGLPLVSKTELLSMNFFNNTMTY
jgi:hypothetical protein